MIGGRVVLALTLVGAIGFQAPTIVGRVTDRTTGEPVAGVVVSALDAKGKILSRGVTDRATGFRLVISDEVSRIQFRKIGYSPAQVPVSSAKNGRIDVIMDRLPTLLPPVRAVDVARCDPAPDRQEALAMWDEVRAGVLASIVARESKAARISILIFSYQLGDGDKPLPQTLTRVTTESASRTFRAARTPEDLAKKGYIEETRAGPAYLAPDDGVLTHDSFLNSHCFSLAAPAAGDDSTLGVRFQPALDHRKHADVEGVVWLRKNPLEVRSVEFLYVNIDKDLIKARPGGFIEYTLMPNGISMLTRWKIRAANEARSDVWVDESGALIEFIDWAGAEPWAARLAAISGKVYSTNGQPISGVLVRLERTPFAVRTDSVGVFTFVGVPTGPYRIVVGDPRLVQMRAVLRSLSRDIQVPERNGDGTAVVDPFLVESPLAVAERACRQTVEGLHSLSGLGGSGAIFGQVVSAGAGVKSRIDVVVKSDSARDAKIPPWRQLETDATGRFRLCGISAMTTLGITATAGGKRSGSVDVVLPAGAGFLFTAIQVTADGAKPPPGKTLRGR